MKIEDLNALMPDGEYVHTFINPNGGMLIGADWKREDVLDLAKKNGARFSGPQARAMKHGIAIPRGNEWLFIETKE